jgi:glycosyltransferase involved in cell wall biosynthesis
MRIGLFHPSLYLYGGAEVVAVVAANALARSGYDTEILVSRRIDQRRIQEMVGEALDSSIKAIVSPAVLQPRGMFHLYESAARTLIFRSRCDILVDIYSDYTYPWVDVSYMHFLWLNNYEFSPRFPYLKTAHLRQVIAVPYALYEKNLEDYSRKLILTNSDFSAKAIKESLGANSKVLYPPVPSTFYQRELGSNEDNRENLVVTTARFGRGKGVELVPLIASLTNKSIHFVMIGLAHDRNVIDYVKESIKKRHLETRVRIITNASRQEIKTYLSKAKIYLHTTKMEHFGISIAEAMAMGCLPVVHDSGGAPEFVPAKYRYKTEWKAARIIEDTIEKWSARESDLMRRIAERFSEETFANRFIELFSEYAGSRKK